MTIALDTIGWETIAYPIDPALWLSPTFSLAAVTGSSVSQIDWNVTLNSGTIVVQTTLDYGATWDNATSGAAIPRFSTVTPFPTILQVRVIFLGSPTYSVLNSLTITLGDDILIDAFSVRWAHTEPDPDHGSGQKAKVRRTAEMTTRGSPPHWFDNFNFIFVPYIEIMSPSLGTWIRFNLGRFHNTLPTLTDDGTTLTNHFNLADRTYRYATKELTEPINVPSGTDSIDFVHDSLAAFGETLFSFPATVNTVIPMTFQPGETYLEMYNTILEAAGFTQLIVDESGTWICSVATDLSARFSEWVYAPLGSGGMLTEASVVPELTDVPNKIIFVPLQGGPTLPVEGNGIRTKINQSTGPSSIDARGETITITRQVNAQNQAALDLIAASEAQRIFAGGGYNIELKVAWNPLHSDSDVITIWKPRLNIPPSIWLVTSWSIDLKDIVSPDDVTMNIQASRRVAIT